MVTAAPPSEKFVSWPSAFALTAAVYLLAGLVVRPLAVPPGYAIPLFPAAGVALASVLLFGRRMLPAVSLGAFSVAFVVGLERGTTGPAALAEPAAIAVGATLQAFLGAGLVERYLPSPLTLSEPREIGGFLLAGMTSCLASTVVGNLALWLAGSLAAQDLPLSVSAWWIGDLLGVLVAAPVLLTLLGRPRDVWRPRRLSVGLTLSLVTLLLGLGIHQAMRWNRERTQTAFDHDAASAVQALAYQLNEPMRALEALNSVFMASDHVTAAEMHLAARSWLASGRLQAVAWSQFVPKSDLADFQSRVRRESDQSDFTVFDRTNTGQRRPTTGDAFVVRYVEPVATNAPALGLNLLSVPPILEAIDAARRTGEPVATPAIGLVQSAATEHQAAVVLYEAVYLPRIPAASERLSATLGTVSVVLRMEDQLQALAPFLPAYLSLCLLDRTPGATTVRLAGPVGCEARTAPLQLSAPMPYASRQWEVRVTTGPGMRPNTPSGDVWLFSLVGLLSTAVLGAFLLTMTGRTRRIEVAVSERTAALQAEVREREVAEAALRDSERRFRNILNNVPIGVIYTDLRGNVKQSNPRFCELTGYSAEELLQMGMADYTHPDDLLHDLELMAQLVRGDIPMYRRHKRYITRSGATVWVQATVSLLRDAQARPRSIVGVVEDITDDLKLEEAERAREAAEASNQAKSEFLSRMSHELRTPLNAMLGFAQLLELDPRHPLAEAQRPWVVQIQQAGWHLLEMINDVLDLSRIESGNLRLQTATLDMEELLAATLTMVEADARQANIGIGREFAPGTTTALGDATRVKQILTNLLSNAVKYNVEGGHIQITGRKRGADAVEITISDTGLGMTAAQLSALFQPFNRLGRERSTQQGTGIGLVISRRLAELMGGSLRVRSVAGEGSAFVLTLPCAAEPDTVPSVLNALSPLPADYHRRVVHYVEDNETNVEVMRGILAQRPQVEMEVSITGLDGLAAIRARHPDLILLDMHLPDISGMELLRHLKNDAATRSVPIVVVSADALVQQIDAAFQAGCARYLTKPVNVGELLAVIDDLLEEMDTRFG